MNPFLVFVGLSGLTYLFARDALQSEMTFAYHVLPMLILVAVVVFRKAINEKRKTLTGKINAKVEAMAREERHLRKEKSTHCEPPRSQRDDRAQEVNLRQRLDERESLPGEVLPENRDLNKEA